ncbi:MAG TPA: hypothetical protein VEJ87_15380, partial [Acidimicrobiales bacterium]|nr:hypothetical protein [Acidimicrobiales bacterium]
MDERDDKEHQEAEAKLFEESPISERVRIIGAQPAGAARRAEEDASSEGGETGGVFSTGLFPAEQGQGQDAVAPIVPEMPHWTEPPTGQVPAVLERRGSGDADRGWSASDTGPSWREQPHEWDDSAFEPLLADPKIRMGALEDVPVEERRPWEFSDELTSTDELSFTGEHERVGETTAGRRSGPGDSSFDQENAGASPARPLAGDERAGDKRPMREQEGGWWDEVGADLGEAGGGNGAASAPSQSITEPPTQRVHVHLDTSSSEPGRVPQLGATRLATSPTTGASVSPVDRETRGFTDSGQVPSVGQVHGSRRSRHRQTARRSRTQEHTGETGGSGRNVPIAAATGIIVAAIALICFAVGTVATLVLVTVIVALASAECYAALRRSGRRPATLLGLVASIAVMIAAYSKGVAALPLVIALVVISTMLWYLAGVERTRPLEGMASTIFG